MNVLLRYYYNGNIIILIFARTILHNAVQKQETAKKLRQ